MLGRLLAKSMFTDVSSNVEEGVPSFSTHVHDDVKLMLYGNKHIDYQATTHQFRVVIAQEMGQIMSRHNYQIVLDYVASRGSAMDQISLSELKDYIFGSPVRAKNRNQSDKFRVVTSAGVLLVIRAFYVSGGDNRHAICLCLPDTFMTALSEVWSHISKWLDECQALLESSLLRSGSSFLPRDLRLQDPQSADSIVQSIFKLLLPLIASHTDIPRLLLYPASCQEFVMAWFKDVFHWLDIKDGHRLRFLPVLLAKITHEYREELIANESTRIVVISGNMAVANKLIFIISGLLKPRFTGPIPTINGTPQAEITKNKGPSKEDDGQDNRYFSTVTNKGWEIPCKTSRYTSTSLSSDESSAHVIQPSSIKSGSSSLQYLSSSMSSAYGSYGSWFNKRFAQSPSGKTNDPSDQPFSLHRNNSSTSLHQMAMNNRITPQPSPSLNEYDEYPWTSTSGSPRVEQTRMNFPSSSGTLLHNIDIKRNTLRITDTTELDEKFESLCLFDSSNLSTTITPGTQKHASVLEVSFEDESQYKSAELLPKYTSYLPTFVPWFQLQAFPIASDSERKVINAMKRDLHSHEYSRTLLISLRSREIKDIVLEKDVSTHKIVQRTKWIFNTGKCASVSPKFQQAISAVECNIKRAMDIWEDTISVDNKEKNLLKIFNEMQS
ncbi:LAFE_0G04324g1_1 [Lachancea fermentati]|uniref:Protein LST4 n=1 Tax=Lachancea fermentati TaxID=4955 RepID=A0A1G4MGZ6_LACFM|nr:LAFE_0G04324g1_1 [Lachancea fermentati]